MKYKFLRAHIKRIAPPADYVLNNCRVVIDGRTFFKDTYSNSGCESILGGEYDRYANYLKTLLKPFVESNVTCYVVFNGGMEAEIEKRTKIHQKVLDRADAVGPGIENVYCDPIFVKDVWKYVLDDLGIKYCVTQYDSTKVFLRVANDLQCPLITRNYEYSLLYTSCISPKSLLFDAESKKILCKIFNYKTCMRRFGIKNLLLPLFFTLVDEQSSYFKRLTDIVECRVKNLFSTVLRWTRWQRDYLEDTLEYIKGILTEEQMEEFKTTYDQIKNWLYKSNPFSITKYFLKDKNTPYEVDGSSYATALANGTLAVPYVNLIYNGTFSGSWVVFDKDQEDAMLPALDIVCYIQYITNFQQKLMFIGRKIDKSCVWEIEKKIIKPMLHDDSFLTDCNVGHALFKGFLDEAIPGFKLELLQSIPKDCWMLIITLVYYCKRKLDLNLAYCIILSYVMLGPVSEKVGVIKRCNFMSPDEIECNLPDANGLTMLDCISAVHVLIDLFYVRKIKRRFDRKILHLFAEFQHCLQHMNYLNKLCGGMVDCTIYHKTINGTFAYNAYLKMEGQERPMRSFEKRLKDTTVLNFYKNIESVFEACLLSVGIGMVLY